MRMDGPSWSGYSSAAWEGDALTVVTSGFRDGLWLELSAVGSAHPTGRRRIIVPRGVATQITRHRGGVDSRLEPPVPGLPLLSSLQPFANRTSDTAATGVD